MNPQNLPATHDEDNWLVASWDFLPEAHRHSSLHGPPADPAAPAARAHPAHPAHTFWDESAELRLRRLSRLASLPLSPPPRAPALNPAAREFFPAGRAFGQEPIHGETGEYKDLAYTQCKTVGGNSRFGAAVVADNAFPSPMDTPSGFGMGPPSMRGPPGPPFGNAFAGAAPISGGFPTQKFGGPPSYYAFGPGIGGALLDLEAGLRLLGDGSLICNNCDARAGLAPQPNLSAQESAAAHHHTSSGAHLSLVEIVNVLLAPPDSFDDRGGMVTVELSFAMRSTPLHWWEDHPSHRKVLRKECPLYQHGVPLGLSRRYVDWMAGEGYDRSFALKVMRRELSSRG